MRNTARLLLFRALQINSALRIQNTYPRLACSTMRLAPIARPTQHSSFSPAIRTSSPSLSLLNSTRIASTASLAILTCSLMRNPLAKNSRGPSSPDFSGILHISCTHDSWTSTVISTTAEYGLIPHEHWFQPDWIDEEKATKDRQVMEKENVIYGG